MSDSIHAENPPAVGTGTAHAIEAPSMESSAPGEQVSESAPASVQSMKSQSALVQGQIEGQVQALARPESQNPESQIVDGKPVSGDRADRRVDRRVEVRGVEAGNAVAHEPQTPLLSAEKPAMVRSAGLPDPNASSHPRGATAVDPAAHGIHALQGQVGSSAPDASTLVRDPAGLHGATSGMTGNSGGTTAATRSAADETFTALDGGTRSGAPNWIHAGAQQAEAGFQDPALGWVGVRADASGGQVHATLIPGSADAAQALGGHMAGLNAYLTETHTPVETLTLATPGSREAAFYAGQNQSSNSNQGFNQSSSQNAGQQGSSESQPGPQTVSPLSTVAVPSETQPSVSTPGPAYGQSGTHISVMA
jgi:hypothetical protein